MTRTRPTKPKQRKSPSEESSRSSRRKKAPKPYKDSSTNLFDNADELFQMRKRAKNSEESSRKKRVKVSETEEVTFKVSGKLSEPIPIKDNQSSAVMVSKTPKPSRSEMNASPQFLKKKPSIPIPSLKVQKDVKEE
jgi:hypothetical protein